MSPSRPPARAPRLAAPATLLLAAGWAAPAAAGSFELFGLDASYQLQGSYALAVRTEKPHDGIINTPPSPKIPIPDFIKFNESHNYDDGDRNFKRGSIVNNRVSFLGELQLSRDDYGVLLRGDAFYDRVYRGFNDNDSLDTMNRTEGRHNFPNVGRADEFSDEAAFYDGRRARLLDAYAYGSWYVGDSGALNLRIGRHIAAWGESLFFSGIALAQSPADATKAAVPGADVKSILLPVNQVSMQFALNSDWTLLGQYKLEYKATELNPVGEFFSVSDVVGPGAQFIWGIENPLYLANLSDLNLLSSDLPETVDLLNDLLNLNLPIQGVTGLLGGLLDRLDPLLPDLNLPLGAIQQPNTPRYINVERKHDIRPSDHGQWGVGLKYQVTPETNVGLYRLRYHNTTPAPVQNYDYAVLLPGSGGLPPLTTQALGLKVPTTYNIRYFDGIDMTAMSFSTTLFGVSVGGEAILREGIDLLVDVDGGLLGPVPTPSRGDVAQGLLSGLYTMGPALFWDALTLVGEASYIHVLDVDQACGPTNCSNDLTYNTDAWGYSLLVLIDRKNVVDGWDLQIPLFWQGIGDGQSSMLSGLGSLMGEGDRRASVGANFTRLQQFTVGVSYNAYLGDPHFRKRPYADRDFAAFTMKYLF
ncbi:DUF1302 domain-containing protein [Solimonas fluminis]|nr:DUF1302 family protein [Solimonas fluminis]